MSADLFTATYRFAASVGSHVLEALWPATLSDYDVPVQDVESECWEPVSPDGYYGYAEPNLDPKPAASTLAADAEAVETDCPPGQSPASALSFVAFSVPAICDVLAEHTPRTDAVGRVYCDGGADDDDDGHYELYADWYEWREHVAECLAERLETSLLNRFPEGK